MQYIKTFEEFLNEKMNITNGVTVFEKDFGVDPKKIVEEIKSAGRGRGTSACYLSAVKVNKTYIDEMGNKLPNPMAEPVTVDGMVAPRLYKVTDYLFKAGIDYAKNREKEATAHGDVYVAGADKGKTNVPGLEGFLKYKDIDPSVLYLVINYGNATPNSRYFVYDDDLGDYRACEKSEIEKYLPPKKTYAWADGTEKKGYVTAGLEKILYIKSNKNYYYNRSLLDKIPSTVAKLVKETTNAY